MTDDEFKAEVLRQFGEVGQQVGEMRRQVGGVAERFDALESGLARRIDEVRQQVEEVRQQVEEVRQQVGGVRQQVDEVRRQVDGVRAELAAVDAHLTGRLDAVVIRLDHQDDAMARLMDKVDRQGAWLRGSAEAAEQAINGLIELSRRVSRFEGRGGDLGRSSA